MTSRVLPSKLYTTLGIIAILLSVFAVYFPSLHFQFVNWDDSEYILNNPLVRQLSFANLKDLFSSFVYGSYLPLTTLSFALEYHWVGYDPFLYHLDNLVLHLVNIGLVFIFIRRISVDVGVALLTALLFGINPLRIESVAWVTQRKDLLYSLFYLLGLIAYLKFINQKSLRNWRVVFILFVFSVLSKPQAISFPLALMAIDFLRRMDFKKAILEKLPFIGVSLIFLFINLQGTAQQIYKLKLLCPYNLFEMFIFCFYALSQYIWKSFLPLSLSCLYPYPAKSGGSLSFEIIAWAVGISVLIVVLLKKSYHYRWVGFGVLLFLATIILPIQNIWFGGHWMDDHHSYLPSIGIFFLATTVILKFSSYLSSWKKIVMAVFIIFYSAFFSWQTSKYLNVWKNGETLWTNVIEKSPNLAMAYLNRGNYYNFNNNYPKALKDYARSSELNPNYAEAYNNHGTVLAMMYRDNLAMDDFNKAIAINPRYAEAYFNVSLLWERKNEFHKALQYARKAKELGAPVPEDYLKGLDMKVNEKASF